jgi:signal transduction histidine kinase
MSQGTGRSGNPMNTRKEAATTDGTINILIVDDEPKNLTVLEAILDDPGYRLVRAESAHQALLSLVAEDFALLILDIRMPGMTGFELAEMIKGRKKTAQVPIIFLTAFFNEDQHVLTGYGTGAVDYLHKPVNASILRSKVAVFAELHRKRREIEKANRDLLDEAAERRRAVEQLRELNENLEQRVAERTETLEDLHRRKDEFLAMMSHELRNPLAPIATALQVLGTQREKENPIQQQARSIIERQTGHLRHLVDDLLEVSRITTGQVQLRRKLVVVNDIVNGAVETVRPLIEERGHELTVSLPPEPIVLEADEARLEQVMVNLLHNAAKYTEGAGRLWLTAEREGERVVIRVRDTGIGISPTLLPRVFELFTQAERSLDRSQGGLGIGLALVQRFTELHGGEVEAFSTLGEGSEFVVRLPLAPEVTPQPALPVPEARQAPTHSLRVLVADDNVDTVETFALLLRQSGHDVRTAYDGEAAVQAAMEYQPDVALLDIGLPGLTGYEVAKRIRLEPSLQSMVLIASTGYGQDSDRRAALQAGFNHHLVKPADFDKLEQILSAVTPRPANKP